jgi:hypothetical protein
MASLVPKFVKKEIVEGWAGESLWLMLLDEDHVPSAILQQYVADVVSNEVVDSGAIYVAGGLALPNVVTQYDGANAYLDADNLQIGPGSTMTYRWGIIYSKTNGTGQATYRIRAHIDFLANKTVNNGTTVVQWNPLGILYVS